MYITNILVITIIEKYMLMACLMNILINIIIVVGINLQVTKKLKHTVTMKKTIPQADLLR